jgi:hypothetical protein
MTVWAPTSQPFARPSSSRGTISGKVLWAEVSKSTLPDPEREQREVEGRQGQPAGERRGTEQGEHDRAHRCPGHHQDATVLPVRQHPDMQRQQQPRQGHRNLDAGDEPRVAGELHHDQRGTDEHDPIGEVRDRRRGPQTPEPSAQTRRNLHLWADEELL